MKKILFKIIISFLVIFIILESTFFLTGQYLLWIRRKSHRPQQECVQIVCVGDSHTFGVGTSAQYSYPKQLESLLNDNNFQDFLVYNIGIPGASTKKQIETLDNFIKNKAIDIVIVLTGRNNQHELEQWEDSFLHKNSNFRFSSLRSARFAQELFRRFIRGNNESPQEISALARKEYLTFYFNRVREICGDQGIKLVMCAYYDSSDDMIKELAKKNEIPYFDFAQDFRTLFNIEERKQYISPDMSHMNHNGYRYFAERVYEKLFLKQKYLEIKIGPLLKKIEDKYFYATIGATEQSIAVQRDRINKYNNSWEYPYELIHLGHIYTEIGKKDLAKQCYLEGLIAANYIDNNTIVSPIITWYLNNDTTENTVAICKEILAHNPENSTAKYYLEWIISNAD